MPSPEAATRPARRFLHTCYCCESIEPVAEYLAGALALDLKMQTPMEPSDGDLLGMDQTIVSAAAFVYDHRGPRTSPSIEIQAWDTPPVVGEPLRDPTAVGMQSIGYAVAAIGPAVAGLKAAGCVEVARGVDPFGVASMTLLDPWGVQTDVAVDPEVPEGKTRMRHLRITVSDLDVSLPWYHRLGFDEIGRASITDGGFVGLGGEVTGTAVRLRLPDEPFEVVLIQWTRPPSHGKAPADPNHAGLYRTAVGVDDTRASYDELRSEGIAFDRAPELVELNGTPVPDMWICFLSDPDGVPFEFVQRPRDAFR